MNGLRFTYVRRFLHNCKNKQTKLIGPILYSELRQSTHDLMRLSQRVSFKKEYDLLQNNCELPKSSSILNLKPFMADGLIRVGGRISQSQYDYDKKHPVILHAEHTFTNYSCETNTFD